MTSDARENKNMDMRLRRYARTQGFSLIKSRKALSNSNSGGYTIVDSSNYIVAGEKFDMLEDDVQKFLTE